MIIKSLNNKSTKLLLAIFISILTFFVSPEIINNNGNLNFLLIITTIVILSFYYLARKYENYYLLALASLLLFSSAFVNIQVAFLFVFAFPLIYIADEFKNKNWKSGLSALAIVLGIYLLSALWMQDWVPDYKNTTLFALGFNMGGVVLILFWIAWIQRGLLSARRTLAFCLPAVLFLLLWITYKGTGKEIFTTIQQNMSIEKPPFFESYIFKAIFFQSIWLFPLAVLKIFLIILGGWQLYKNQLGILVLFLILIISCFPYFSWCKELATILNLLIAIISGFGVLKLVDLINIRNQQICGELVEPKIVIAKEINN